AARSPDRANIADRGLARIGTRVRLPSPSQSARNETSLHHPYGSNLLRYSFRWRLMLGASGWSNRRFHLAEKFCSLRKHPESTDVTFPILEDFENPALTLRFN